MKAAASHSHFCDTSKNGKAKQPSPVVGREGLVPFERNNKPGQSPQGQAAVAPRGAEALVAFERNKNLGQSPQGRLAVAARAAGALVATERNKKEPQP